MKVRNKMRRARQSKRTSYLIGAVVQAMEPRVLLSASPVLIDLANFSGTSNGRLPYSNVVMDSSGDLFGTANSGGDSNIGTVFEVPAGANTIQALGSFYTANGRYPDAGLIIDSSGNLYGTTLTGGSSGNHGTVIEISAGSSSITVLASFNGTNGQNPTDSLTMDSSGNLYGTATGITGGNGAVFELATGSSTITVLASFNGTNGGTPQGSVMMDSSGNLYGTTYTGGVDSSGTIFELAAGSRSITTLATFAGAPGPANPYAGLVMDSSGNLYGTSSSGGVNSPDGTIFELAAGSSTIATLASFNGVNGSNPLGGLIMEGSGDLFGTTKSGGTDSDGTVFELAAGSSTITTVATFNGTNGSQPQDTLSTDSSGNLYGTASYGGANLYGDVFEVALPHAAIAAQPTTVTAGTSQSITVDLESAAGMIDTSDQSTVTLSIASGPSGATIGGMLTGSAVNGVATFSGLTFDTAGNYTITAASSGLTSATTTTINIMPADAAKLAFAQQPASATAYHTMGTIGVAVEDQYGNVVADTSTVTLSSTTTLSGTTSVAAVAGVATFSDVWIGATGSYTLSAGDGSLTSATSDPIAVAVPNAVKALASFNGTNGISSYAGLIADSDGNLYGTTDEGGVGNFGTVFKIAAGSSSITDLALFNASTGQYPAAGLVMDSSGDLFGTTQFGGNGDNGTVFEIAAGSSSITTIASFSSSAGYLPINGLVMNSSGDLFGTAIYGGANSVGTVFEVVSGSNSVTPLASFAAGAGYPRAGLIMDSDGNLYGTESSGGTNDDGAVFELTSGSSSITTLASFNTTDGADPQSGLLMDSQGNLYGTTSTGGAQDHGTFYELAAGSSTITLLASLNTSTGYDSVAGLVMDSYGNMYGTAEDGGANGYGTVLEYSGGTIHVLASLNSSTGQYPLGGLLLGSNGTLYGTTFSGGANGDGAVFEVTNPTSTRAAVTAQPSIITAGTSQSISVNLESFDGSLDTTNQSPVTLSIASGPSGATLGGTLTVQAVNGVAAFSGLTFTIAGTYTLTASSAGGVSAATSPITVNATTASQLAFVQQPADVVAGQSLGTVTVDVEDVYGNLVTTDTSTVALSTATALGGTVSEAAVGGVATFTGLSISLAGTYTLSAADPGLTLATSASFTILPQFMLTDIADLGSTAGSFPESGVVMDSEGNFYGTTTSGGANNDGAIFELAAGSNTVITLASFNANTGTNPQDALIIDPSGDLYGTAADGGANSDGTVFELAAGSSTITTVASFNGTNGASPSGLVTDSSGNLYGTTTTGGSNEGGTLYKIPAGTDVITLVSLFRSATGYNPSGTLVMDSSGNLYGVTYQSGAHSGGAIFEVHANTSTIITKAAFSSTTGENPEAGLLIDSHGNLYGTTVAGGANSDGTVFELAAGASTITPLVSFSSATGGDSKSPLVMDSNGDLFGTTTYLADSSVETAFEIPAGTDSILLLAAFNQPSQYSSPQGGLVIDSSGNVYGTAEDGGSSGEGVVFALSPIPTQTVVTAPPTVSAGTSLSISANLELAGGQVVTTDGSPVTVSIASGPSGATINGTLTVQAVHGIANFSGLTFDTAGTYTLAVGGTGVPSATTIITVTSAAAYKLTIVQQPISAVAGQTIGTVQVVVEDVFGNLVTADGSAVTLATSSGTQLSGSTTVNAGAGVASFTGLSVAQVGTYTLLASDGSLSSAASGSFAVTQAAAAKLVFAEQPAGKATAGRKIGTIQVDVEDAYGNLVIGNDSNVTISANSTAAVSTGAVGTGTTTVAAQNGIAVFSDLAINAAGTYTFAASDAGLVGATSVPVTAATVAGTQIAPLVVDPSTALPQSTLTSKRLMVRIESQASGKTVLRKTVLVQQGQAVFSHLNLHKAGVYNVIASNRGGSAMIEQITVVASVPTKLAFVSEPAAVNGHAPIAVDVLDQYGNVIKSANWETVTLHLDPYPSLGIDPSLSGTVTNPVVNGVATFTDVAVDHTGRGRLIATSAGLRPAVSTVFDNA